MEAVPAEDKPEKISFFEKAKFAITAVGLIGTAVTAATYFGFKPEKKKLLQLEYLSKASLVNKLTAPGEDIKVTYRGNQVEQLTVVAARFSNSGEIPVDSSDIKDGAFPSITFLPTDRIIRAEIKNRFPSNLVATLSETNNVTRIEHGLMNPGDWLDIQLFIGGDYSDALRLPPVSYRISGIQNPITKYPSSKTQSTRNYLFGMSRTGQYGALILASVLPVLAFFAVIGLTGYIFSSYRSVDRALSLLTEVREKYRDAAPPSTITQMEIRNTLARAPSPLGVKMEKYLLRLDCEPRSDESTQAYTHRITKELSRTVIPKTNYERVKLIGLDTLFSVLFSAALCWGASIVVADAWQRVLYP